MAHLTDTPARPLPMPHHTHLLRRGSRYYLNVKVPKDLRAALGKELIRKALGTSDPHEAARQVRFEAYRMDSEFESKRRELLAAKREKPQMPSPLKISDKEAHEIVCEFFVKLEKDSEDWSECELPKMHDSTKRELVADLRMDSTASDGQRSGPYSQDDGRIDLENFLNGKGWTILPDSPAYKRLCSLFRRARRENTLRNIDRLLNRTVIPQETVFRGVFAHTPTKSFCSVSLPALHH